MADDGVRGEFGRRSVHGEQVPVPGAARRSGGAEEVGATAHREQLAVAAHTVDGVRNDHGVCEVGQKGRPRTGRPTAASTAMAANRAQR